MDVPDAAAAFAWVVEGIVECAFGATYATSVGIVRVVGGERG